MKTDLDELKQAIPIIDLARDLGLQVKGKQARCFNISGHKRGDKTPSIGFDLKTNRFKCFACGVNGTIIDLYKEIKGVDVSQAIKELAQIAGLPAGKSQYAKTGPKRHSPIKIGESYIYAPKALKQAFKPQKTAIFKALGNYCGGLDSQSLDYLTGPGRGLTKETLTRFKLFSIKDYPATNNYLKEQFSIEQLQEAGLVSEAGNLIFYQHKIIIPFMENRQIIFLQGRRINKEHPRYMHIKNPVQMFNIDTLKGLSKGDKVYICEGAFDAMMLEQNGYKAVAILGVNNFKPDMAQLFKGLDVVLCLDNDEQGQKATQELARVFLLQAQSVKEKKLPEGIKDITEYFIK
jgi:DNA primase